MASETPKVFTYDLNVVIGDTWPPGPPGTEFIVAVEHKGTFLRLDNTTVTATAKNRLEDVGAFVTFEVSVKDQSTNPGRVGLKLPVSETVKLAERDYPWDLQVVWDADGTTLTPIKGLLKAQRDVTA